MKVEEGEFEDQPFESQEVRALISCSLQIASRGEQKYEGLSILDLICVNIITYWEWL